MKAVAYQQSLPITDDRALIDINLPDPVASGRDLLVEVKAISVNPVDTKVRQSTTPPAGDYKVLGWDAAGIVRAVGDRTSLFKVGDRVWYAGSLVRQGTNSELHLVDERIVGYMPQSLDFAHAAAMPLTTITAWELLFDRLQLSTSPGAHEKDALLIIGAAGGVGSIMVQLARKMTDITVVATASRPATVAWVKELGAHHVIDHTRSLSAQLNAIGIPNVRYIASLNQSGKHFPELVEAIAPQGRLALIDDPDQLDVRLLKRKSASLHWEFMFARAMFETPDMQRQHELLNQTAQLIDAGTLKTTLGEHFGTIDAANLRRAHALLESNTAKGKIVLEGF